MKSIALAIVLFVVPILAQQKDNYENFVNIGTTDEAIYFVNYKDAKGTYAKVAFKGAIMYRDGDIAITSFLGNCGEMEISITGEEYFRNRRSIGVRAIEPTVSEKVPKNTAIWIALDLVCQKKFGIPS